MPRMKLALAKKKKPRHGICNAIENGEVCSNPVYLRGLCSRHYNYCQKNGLLDEIGDKPKKVPKNKRTFVPKDINDRKPGICNAIVDDVPCENKATRKGLCTRHYQTLHRQDKSRLPEFQTDLHEHITILKEPTSGKCRIAENGIPCTRETHARGLCTMHYKWFKDRGLLDQYGIPPRSKKRYTLRKNIKEGRCRAAENGHGCGEPAVYRGLCEHHYNIISKDKTLMALIASPKRETTELRRNPSPHPATCAIMENGKACSNPATHRGICERHRKMIVGTPRFKMDELADPITVDDQPFEVSSSIMAGTCRAIIDGIPCPEVAYKSGLCRKHYRRALTYKFVDKVSLKRSTTPHWYLDKNILFDHADWDVFGKIGQQASVEIISAIHQGTVRASISADAAKTTYNHIRHRLQRGKDEGGREYAPDDADEVARDYLQRVITDHNNLWQIVALPAGEFALEMTRKQGLSLEDAWEWRAYQFARRHPDPPTLFITRDSDFDSGVSPQEALKKLPFKQRRQ